MAPRKPRKVVGAVVKTTRKVVEETVKVAAVVGAEDVEEAAVPLKDSKVVQVVVEEKGAGAQVGGEEGEGEAPEENDGRDEPEKRKEDENQHDQKTEETQTPKESGEESKKAGEGKGRRRRRRRWGSGGVGGGYKRYVFRVLKQVHPELGASGRAMQVLDMMMADMFQRLAEEAARLSKYTGRATLTSREIQSAVRLVLPGELGRHAISEGTKAVATYMASHSS